MSDLKKFTVAELIEKLQQLSPDAPVRLEGCCGSACGYWSGEIMRVEFDVNGQRIVPVGGVGEEYILNRKD